MMFIYNNWRNIKSWKIFPYFMNSITYKLDVNEPKIYRWLCFGWVTK